MTTLDPELQNWKSSLEQTLASWGDPAAGDAEKARFDEACLARAKEMSSVERVQTMDKLRQIKRTMGEGYKLSIRENRFILTLISSDRADAVRSRAASSKAAKTAVVSSGPMTQTDLESLL